MKNKKLILVWFLVVFLFLLFVGLFNYTIDPYQQYRKATLYPMLFEKNHRYINPGLAKTYNYKSIVIGSSMTQNFIINEVEEKLDFNKTIKLCMSSATGHEKYQILKTSFRHKTIEAVFYGLDVFAFFGKPNKMEPDVVFPFYLYDDDRLNDYNYIFNFDVALKGFAALVKPYLDSNNPLYQYDLMWQWQHGFENAFGKEKALNRYLARYRPNKKFKTSLYLNNLENSFNQNVVFLIAAHPETTFIFFYPPYSILAYYDWNKKGALETLIKFKHYIFEKTKVYKNVRLYDFQSAEEIIMNLDNYRDFSHYHQKINTWILGEIEQNNYRVTEENIDSYDKKLLDLAKGYVLPEIKASPLSSNFR